MKRANTLITRGIFVSFKGSKRGGFGDLKQLEFV
jgi:hypothetical protein